MSRRLRSATDHGVAGPATGTAGERFARALAAKDVTAFRALLADPIDFQALTPGRHWQASAPGEVVGEVILGRWFGADDDIEALESLSSTRLPGRERISYLLRVRNADGEHLVEQQAYYSIAQLRTFCDRCPWGGPSRDRHAAGHHGRPGRPGPPGENPDRRRRVKRRRCWVPA